MDAAASPTRIPAPTAGAALLVSVAAVAVLPGFRLMTDEIL